MTTAASIPIESEKVWTPWVCPESEKSYYSIPSPSSTQSVLLQLFSPLTPYPLDRTYGRAALPRSPAEERIRKEFKYREGKVLLHLGKEGSEVEVGEVAYNVWLPNVKDIGKDLVFCHGINDYGAKFSEHAKYFLDQGYRVIVPDLPSHGRSFGIHVHLTDMSLLADAVWEVVKDVVRFDLTQTTGSQEGEVQDRKTFIAGQSLGGYVAVLTCIKYGKSEVLISTEDDKPSTSSQLPKITGGVFLCPMLAISNNSRPSYFIEILAKTISTFLSSLPLASAIKGKVSEDPYVEQQFLSDPMTYHGKLRVSTGLAILEALIGMEGRFADLKVDFLVVHGTGDRVTSCKGSERLFKESKSEDKDIKLYEGYEHILLRKGRNPEDDSRRQRVLKDIIEWLDKH